MGRKEISALSHFDGDEIMLVRTEQNRPECDLKDFPKNVRKESDFPALQASEFDIPDKVRGGGEHPTSFDRALLSS
jgi:hypothetical protein